MATVLSSKGQIVLNAPLRRSLGLVPGTTFSVHADDGKIIMEKVAEGKPKGVLVRDPRTRKTALDVFKGTPILTSARVRDVLANFS